MRILFWADGFWPRIGGTETQGLQFVQGMQARGHQCLVIAQKHRASWKDEEVFQDIPINRFDFNALIQSKDVTKIRPIKERLEKAVAEFSPDIVYLNTLENGSAFVFLLCRKTICVPTVITIHTPYYNGPVYPLVQQICRQADYICSASQWGFDTIKKYLPPLKNPLQMIYYGLYEPNILPKPLPFSPPTILLLGRLSWEKGFYMAIVAFDLLKKTGSPARLLIAGDGPERLVLKDLVSRLGLDDCVEFTGELLRDGDAVFSVINRATFVVMPSLFEAFGLVALEAMQMGRPVIASNVGGLPEIVSHKETGLLICLQDSLKQNTFRQRQEPNQDDAPILCEAMQTLLNHPEQTIRMGEKARQWAIKTYRLEENLNRYEELFLQLA